MLQFSHQLFAVRLLPGLLLSAVLLTAAFLPSAALADESDTMVRPEPFVEVEQSSITTLPPLPGMRPSLPLNAVSNIQTAPQASTESSASGDVQVIADPTDGVRGRMANPDPATSPAVQQAKLNGQKWIQVDLSEQKTYAYEGTNLVNEFVVSTGMRGTPTVTGEFRMWVRTPTQTMSGGSQEAGDYYSLPNVQWVQYFYGDYGFHGAYWHNNFGNPMSRGCVNMTNEDAKWLYDWAFPQWDGSRDWFRTVEANATLVIVHP